MLRRFQVPRRPLARGLHTSTMALAFKKSSDSPVAQRRMQTPRKGSSDFRAFPEVAAYSRHHETAPELSVDESHVVVASAETVASIKPGTVVTWPGDVQAQLTHLGSFRPQQFHELFRTHAALVRGATEQVLQQHLQPGKALFVTGDPGVGKSTLLTQAHAAAKLQGWAVIHISQADSLVNGSVDAVYNKDAGVWEQPMFMGRLWKKTLKGNRDIVGKQKSDASDRRTLQSLIKTLSSSTNVLLTVDDLNAWSASPFALNTDVHNKRIYHRDLEVPRTVLGQLEKPDPKVCVMGATSGSFKPMAMQGHAYSSVSEFDPKLAGSVLKAAQLELGRLSGEEVQAYVDYLMQAKVAKGTWREQFQVSGNGNPRDILRSCVNYAF